jgi:RNA polymerase sigma factor (sigma-70 family)
MALINGHGPDDATFSSYLYIAIRNEAATLARRETRERALTKKLAAQPPDRNGWERAASDLEDSLWSLAVIRAYRRLSARHRFVLRATAIDRHSKTAVCEALNMSPNTVDALAYRARKALRRYLAIEHLRVESAPLPAQRDASFFPHPEKAENFPSPRIGHEGDLSPNTVLAAAKLRQHAAGTTPDDGKECWEMIPKDDSEITRDSEFFIRLRRVNKDLSDILMRLTREIEDAQLVRADWLQLARHLDHISGYVTKQATHSYRYDHGEPLCRPSF